jgi:hypothetical protein
MINKFSEWLILREQTEDAILGVIGGSDPITGVDEREHLSNRSTKEFGPDVIQRLKNLGIIKNIANDDPMQYQAILDAIDQGIQVRELIGLIDGQTKSQSHSL